MKVAWISPKGYGLGIARSIRDQGHQIVVYSPLLHDLPTVEKHQLAFFSQKADLVVIDGPFPLEPTRHSWKPAREAVFIDELRRHYNVLALGPTPTVDLLVGDARYLRKNCRRLGIPYDRGGTGELWTSGAWFRKDAIIPDGPFVRSFLPIFKAVGFRGWFELTGVLQEGIPVVSGCQAVWAEDTIPEGREAEFLQQMMAQ